MTLHKDLTGAELHEPKGVDTASAGDVYVANGSGSGTWDGRYSGVLTLNQYWMTQKLTDISTPSDRVFFHVPVQSELVDLAVILDGAITTADAMVSIYINNILFADDLAVPFTGSTAGQTALMTATTANTISANSVIEVRTDGASDTVRSAFITIGLRAK